MDKTILDSMYNNLEEKGPATDQVDQLAMHLGMERVFQNQSERGELEDFNKEYLDGMLDRVKTGAYQAPDANMLEYLVANYDSYASSLG